MNGRTLLIAYHKSPSHNVLKTESSVHCPSSYYDKTTENILFMLFNIIILMIIS